MIDVKQAVNSAERYIQDVYGEQVSEIFLEEVERIESDWMITMSFVLPFERVVSSPSSAIDIGAITHRSYKILQIDSETGVVKSMRIREISL
jgi:hypothetical protein